jgi:hypothetical protein
VTGAKEAVTTAAATAQQTSSLSRIAPSLALSIEEGRRPGPLMRNVLNICIGRRVGDLRVFCKNGGGARLSLASAHNQKAFACLGIASESDQSYGQVGQLAREETRRLAERRRVAMPIALTPFD